MTIDQAVTDVINDADEIVKTKQELLIERDAKIIANYKRVASAVVANKFAKSKNSTNELNSSMKEYIHFELLNNKIEQTQTYITFACKKMFVKNIELLIKLGNTKHADITRVVNELNELIILKLADNKQCLFDAINRANNLQQISLIAQLNIEYDKKVIAKFEDNSTRHARLLVSILDDYVKFNIS